MTNGEKACRWSQSVSIVREIVSMVRKRVDGMRKHIDSEKACRW